MKRQRISGRWVLDPAVAPWFVLSGVGIAETSRKDLAENFFAIKDRYFQNWRDRPWDETEIKGRYLHSAVMRLAMGERPWHKGYRHLTTTTAKNLCAELGRLFSKFRPITYAVAIDKAPHARKSSPREPVAIAYSFLQQRLALLIDDIYGDAEGALMVADQEQGHEKMFRSGQMLTIRTEITEGLPRQPNFDLLLDRPVWIDSKLHPLDREILQMPDLVCYAVGELLRSGSAPEGHAFMWPEVRSCFACHFTTGAIPDAGISIYPRPRPYPSL